MIISFEGSRTRIGKVSLFNRQITATVSSVTVDINKWIDGIYAFHDRRIRAGLLVAGLGVQWRPGSDRGGQEPTAVVQICVVHRCLIVQLAHCSKVPRGLKGFLADARVSFTGVGIADDVRRLGFLGLQVGNPHELRKLAAAKHGSQWSNVSMGNLAHLVLALTKMTKERRVGCSNWEAQVLSAEQVKYSCNDAYVAIRLGMELLIRGRDAGNTRRVLVFDPTD